MPVPSDGRIPTVIAVLALVLSVIALTVTLLSDEDTPAEVEVDGGDITLYILTEEAEKVRVSVDGEVVMVLEDARVNPDGLGACHVHLRVKALGSEVKVALDDGIPWVAVDVLPGETLRADMRGS